MKKWSDFYRQMVDRNIGVISAEEQNQLQKTCVAIAGCGGMGGLSAEQLIRLGVGHVKIADFDNFETHNLSRQCGSTSRNVGQHKASVLARYFKEINPEACIEVFPRGVQPENAEEFVEGADVVIDGIDYTAFYHAVMLHRAARKKDLCVISPNAIGFGASILVFGPKTASIEEYVGLPEDLSRQEIEEFKIPAEKFAPYMPSYVTSEMAGRVVAGQMNIPNIIMPQHLGTSIAVSEAVMLTLKRVKEPEGPFPRIFVIDLQDRKTEITG
ncbi:MAG: ThiF family adenylyltransferase [Candidatus Omnitrophota bacterium]